MLAYIITNILNGKQYIGITTQSLNIRWSEHISRSRYNKSKSAIHSAIRKYGKENFVIEQIASAINLENLNKLEEILIEQYNTFLCGYNLTPGGDFKIISEETKKRISATKMGHTVSSETREKLSQYTKDQWKKDREKLRLSNCENWIVVYKDGTQIVVKDLKTFSAQNKVSVEQLYRRKVNKLNIINVIKESELR